LLFITIVEVDIVTLIAMALGMSQIC
jgi:hypothetical protein